MASKGLWLAVKVISGSNVLFVSKIVQCAEHQSFRQLLSHIEGGCLVRWWLATVLVDLQIKKFKSINIKYNLFYQPSDSNFVPIQPEQQEINLVWP